MVSRNRYWFCSLLCGFVILLVFETGCRQKDVHQLDEHTFARTLGELMIINRLSVPDSVKTAMVRQLFKDERISEKDFLSTKATFKQDEVFWQAVYHKAEQYIKTREKELQRQRLKQ